VLGYLNDALSEEAFDPPILMTMVYGVIDPVSGRATIGAAGHPAPLLVKAPNRAEPVAVTGPILGAKLPNTFATADAQLEAGESLVFYSDGVTENANPIGHEFSTERLREVLSAYHGRRAAEIGEGVERAMQNHLEGFSPADDMTFIVATRPVAPLPAPTPADADGLVPDSVRTVLPRKLQRVRSDSRGRIKAGWKGRECIIFFGGVVTWQLAPTLREITRHAKAEAAAGQGRPQ